MSPKKYDCLYLIALSLLLITSSGMAAPGLIAPADDARFGSDDGIVIFEWEDTHPEYEIELGIDEDFSVGTGPLDAGVDNFYNLSDLIPDDVWFPITLTLFWRVRGVSDDLVSTEWSEPFCLHKSVLSSPLIESGSDGRYNHLNEMPYLSWEQPGDVNHYSLEFSLNDAFDPVIGRLNVTDSYLDFSELDRTSWDILEGIFYWRVSFVTPSQVPGVSSSQVPGPWSDACRISKTRISAPGIIGPEDGAVFAPTSTPAILEWESLNTIEQYDVRFYADAEGLIDVFTIGHSESVSFDFKEDLGLSDEVWWYAPFTLYWAVAGYDNSGRPGPFSSPREMIKPGYRRIAAYGDSITDGKCYENGYLDMLCSQLAGIWGSQTSCVNIAVPGMKSKWGAENMEGRLKSSCPQYVLIMFGTNDSVDPGNCDPPFECDVAGHLADMIDVARSRGTIPIIGTIIPVNPEGNLAGAQRSVDANNDSIIQMAWQMGVDWVDLSAMFFDHGNLPSLFCDWGHPNEAGYQIMASGFFDGIMDASR